VVSIRSLDCCVFTVCLCVFNHFVAVNCVVVYNIFVSIKLTLSKHAHTHIHTHTHMTHTHTHTHKHSLTYTHVHRYTHTHTHTHKCAVANVATYVRTCVCCFCSLRRQWEKWAFRNRMRIFLFIPSSSAQVTVVIRILHACPCRPLYLLLVHQSRIMQLEFESLKRTLRGQRMTMTPPGTRGPHLLLKHNPRDWSHLSISSLNLSCGEDPRHALRGGSERWAQGKSFFTRILCYYVRRWKWSLSLGANAHNSS